MKNIRLSPLDSQKIKIWTARDPVLSHILRLLLQRRTIGPEECYASLARRSGELTVHYGCIHWGSRIVVPPKEREVVMDMLRRTSRYH